MTRIVKAERFSLAEAWQVACHYADGKRDETTKSKWTSLLKRYPDVSMPLYEMAKVTEIREAADNILLRIPFGISPRIIAGMLHEGMTGVNKPEPGTKVASDDSDDEDSADQKPVIRKVTQKPVAKNPEKDDIAAMLAQMEGRASLEEV